MRRGAWVVAVAGAVLLTGCENNAASYQIGGDKDHAITLVREQRYVWSGMVEQSLVVASMPDCQRRHQVASDAKRMTGMELFATGEGALWAHQGKRWYAIDTARCTVAEVQDDPQNAGERVGAFEQKNGALVFAAEAASAPAQTPQ
ncbi:MAG: hypothetical protein QM639_13390 [Rhodocyclaceae bacterium]